MPVPVEQIRVGTVVEIRNGSRRRVVAIELGEVFYFSQYKQNGDFLDWWPNAGPTGHFANHADRIVSQPAPPDREAKVAALVEAATAVHAYYDAGHIWSESHLRNPVDNAMARLGVTVAALSPTEDAK